MHAHEIPTVVQVLLKVTVLEDEMTPALTQNVVLDVSFTTTLGTLSSVNNCTETFSDVTQSI